MTVVDPTTLRDLEIVSTSIAGNRTLLRLLDRTRTRVGGEHLRRRLISSARFSDEILALQIAHQELAANDSTYRELIHSVDLDGTERYLGLDWQLPHDRRGAARFARFWRPSWYRHYLADVMLGQAKVIDFLRGVQKLCTQLTVADATLLKDVGKTLAEQCDSDPVRELLRPAKRLSTTVREDFDQLARQRARPILSDIIDCVGTIEAMWSIAIATKEHGWSYPRPSNRLNIRGLFHPFVDEPVIRNDFEVGEQIRVCFVTGPNMAGKSTFLKAVAIATFLAQCGCGVPATEMEFVPVATVFASIHVDDDLTAGESFYLAEVRRMRTLALALRDNGRALAIVDEPFRGTNVLDAADATLAVISRLVAQPDSLVFIASHLGQIVPRFGDDPRISLVYFAVDVTDGHPHCDYRLRHGVSTQRLGMMLLENEKVLDLLQPDVTAASASDRSIEMRNKAG